MFHHPKTIETILFGPYYWVVGSMQVMELKFSTIFLWVLQPVENWPWLCQMTMYFYAWGLAGFTGPDHIMQTLLDG